MRREVWRKRLEKRLERIESELRPMEVEKVLKRIGLLLDYIEDMICTSGPTSDLLYIYSEVEDIYNTLKRWDK